MLSGRWGAGRFLLLLSPAVVHYIAYEHTQFQPGEFPSGVLPRAVTLVPVPEVVWFTLAWAIFSGLLLVLLATGRQPRPPESDLAIRRAALLVVAGTYAFEFGARIVTARLYGIETEIGSARLGLAAGGILALAALLRWTPSAPRLAALVVLGGVALRAASIAFIRPESTINDNLVTIRLSLELLLAGQTPYVFHQFPTHVQPMPYLPWSLLAYVPSFLLGLDIRVTNVLFSLVLVGALWATLRALEIAPAIRNGLILAAAVVYALPKTVGADVLTEWSIVNTFLVATYALLALRRYQPAAVAYGFALGSLLIPVYFAPPILRSLGRSLPLRAIVRLAAIAGLIAALPVLAFLIWDAEAFLTAVLYPPTLFWWRIDEGVRDAANSLPWQIALGPWLRLLQGVVFVGFLAVVWTRVRHFHGLVAVSAAGYVALVLSGPLVVPHLVTVVLYLVVLAEAARAAGLDREAIVERGVRPAG